MCLWHISKKSSGSCANTLYLFLLVRGCLCSWCEGTHEVLHPSCACEFWARRSAGVCGSQLSQGWANGPCQTAQHGGKQDPVSPQCQYSAPYFSVPEPGHLQKWGLLWGTGPGTPMVCVWCVCVQELVGLVFERSDAKLGFFLRCHWLNFSNWRTHSCPSALSMRHWASGIEIGLNQNGHWVDIVFKSQSDFVPGYS